MSKQLPHYYDVLCLSSSATADEIRRAYRVLARRYHPDVNPGKASEEKFKAIAEAYSILGNPELRSRYDLEFGEQLRGGVTQKIREYQKRQAQGERTAARARYYEEVERRRRTTQGQPRPAARPSARVQDSPFAGIKKSFGAWKETVLNAVKLPKPRRAHESTATSTASAEHTSTIEVQKISILEVSVSAVDALHGIKKSVEISQPEGMRKVSVTIPPGVRTGTVLRFRDKGGSGEELVFILRVATHPFLSIENKGLVVEVPISVGEAFSGASVTLPTLDDSIVVRIPAGSQSGSEIRVKGHGIVDRNGNKGDLFYRLMITLPDAISAIGLKEKISEIEGYYANSVRHHFPKGLLSRDK